MRRKFRMLLLRITRRNRHPSLDWGLPIGREYW